MVPFGDPDNIPKSAFLESFKNGGGQCFWMGKDGEKSPSRWFDLGIGCFQPECGGEGGIWTHDPAFRRDTAFRERRHQPLGHLSNG